MKAGLGQGRSLVVCAEEARKGDLNCGSRFVEPSKVVHASSGLETEDHLLGSATFCLGGAELGRESHLGTLQVASEFQLGVAGGPYLGAGPRERCADQSRTKHGALPNVVSPVSSPVDALVLCPRGDVAPSGNGVTAPSSHRGENLPLAAPGASNIGYKSTNCQAKKQGPWRSGGKPTLQDLCHIPGLASNLRSRGRAQQRRQISRRRCSCVFATRTPSCW